MSGVLEDSQLERISNFVAGIVEVRDPDLNGHHHRVGESAVEFAKYVGCPGEEAELLSVGARIHDIGKLSINEHILNKPARLTAAECAIITKTTTVAAIRTAWPARRSRCSHV